jgi:hypothetical protein
MSGSTTIHSVAKSAPELALLAATIELAVSDARGGDVAAYVWLRGPICLAMLAHLAPAGTDARALQQRLINRLEAERD